MEYIIDKSNVKKRLDKFILEQNLKINRRWKYNSKWQDRKIRL